MYNVSEAFLSTVAENTITDKIQGTIYLKNNETIPFSDEDIKQGTLTIDNQCINGEEIEFGAVYAGQISFQIQNDASRYDLYGAKIELSYFLKIGDSYEELPMGVYWVTEATRNGLYLKITALDALSQMDDDFDQTTVYGTPFVVLSYIAEKVGLDLENTEEEIKGMPNGKASIQIDGESNCATWRDCVAIIAQMLGGFVTAARTGGIKISTFGSTPCFEMPADKHQETEIADFDCNFMGLQIETDSGLYESYDENKKDGLVMKIDNNVLFWTGNQKGTQKKVDDLRERLILIDHTPSTVSMIGMPFIELGDMVTYTFKGEKYNSIITSYAWNYRDKCKYVAVGKNPRLTSAKSKADRATSDIRKEVDKNKIVFLKATNAQEIKATTEETDILRFQVTSVSDTNVIFIAQILCNVKTDKEQKDVGGKIIDSSTGEEKSITFRSEQEKPCEITCKYTLAGTEIEAFRPKENFSEGNHILSLFFILPDMAENTTSRFTVKLSCSSGSITIPQENAKGVVIGQGLATGKADWDGTLEFTEIFDQEIEFKNNMSVGKFVESIEIVKKTPKTTGIVEVFGGLSLSNSFRVGIFNENISLNETIKKEIIATKDANVMTFGRKYVKFDEQFEFETNYSGFKSSENKIDTGRMTKLEIDTEQFARVDEISIERE